MRSHEPGWPWPSLIMGGVALADCVSILEHAH